MREMWKMRKYAMVLMALALTIILTPDTVTAASAAVPGSPMGVTAAAGDGQATVSFSPPASDGGSAITGYIVTASPGGAAATGTASPITVNGLTNGTDYTFTVAAVNAAGTGAASMASNSVKPFAVPPSIDDSFINMGGILVYPDSIDPEKPSITMEVKPAQGVAYVSIPADILQSYAERNADFFMEIRAPYGSYRLPARLPSLIPGLSELLKAQSLSMEDIRFRITLTDKSSYPSIQSALTEGLPNAQPIGPAVDFGIEIVRIETGQVIGHVDTFKEPVIRLIPLPSDLTAMPERWGVFRYDEANQRFDFVPARAIQIDGFWHALINSNTNSVYVAADNAVSFSDVPSSHWAYSAIDLAASKGLVAGVGGGRFAPSQPVTGAEFAAMLKRAIGVEVLIGNGAASDQPLTREEMASMLAAAVRSVQPQTAPASVSLDAYKDIAAVSLDHLADIQLMIELGIMTGSSADTFDPKGVTTRAQAAIVFVRTLQALELIDG
ncbi:S-layer-like y domain-containing protein [Cohnella lubricantis]|nr:S-layer homology domain-containing protein [Cohnella lubricantis]MBP2118016.1 hypothetical protein [Cohnella lubricantis]